MSWEANPWTMGFFRGLFRKKGFDERATWPLVWRRAETQEWPPVAMLGDDYDWARQTGTGFFAEHADEKLYLIERDWFGWPDPPQWGLASFNKTQNKWRLWGNFDDLPPSWKVPNPLYAKD